MQEEEYQSPQAGQVVKTPQGYNAFVPAPLPPPLLYTDALVLALSRADAALSELAGVGRMLPNPHLLIGLYTRREAVLSSRIEGTRTEINALLLDEFAQNAEPPAVRTQPEDADLREVRNYVRALEYGIERLQALPLSLRLIRELHALLMESVRGGHATPGEFRRSQNWIGAPGSTLATATYVPPPVEHLMDCLSNWEEFVHQKDTHPDLIQCALLHEQFEAIHPFLDGNGRIGRLFITLFLIERERLDQPLLYLSDYIERNRQDYYRTLQSVRTHGDWEGWLLYFLEGVRVTSEQGIRQARELMDLRETFRRRLSDKPKALALLDHLFVNPYITAARAEMLLAITRPTAQVTIDHLVAEGVLGEISGRSWGRLYLAQPILQALATRRE